MTKERVDSMLREYRYNLGRLKNLEVEIPRFKDYISRLSAKALEVMADPYAARMDGMPRGGSPKSSAVERAAIMIADGEDPPFIREAKSNLRTLECEYRRRRDAIAFVDAWLCGLAGRERWIVEQQVINGVTWREVILQHEKTYGEPRTKDGLKRLKNKALMKIYHIAE